MVRKHPSPAVKTLPAFCFFLLLALSLLLPASVLAACDILLEDFASASGWTTNRGESWVVTGGKLDVHDIGTTSTYAGTRFVPSDFFSVDVEIDILSASGLSDRVGVQIYNSGDVFFNVEGGDAEITTNLVLCYYYPVAKELKFKVYDILSGEWITPLAPWPWSGSVSSIGLSMLSDGVVFRVNGQDTSYKLSSDFSLGPILDTLRVYGGGTALQARFDNICSSTLTSADKAMPVPRGQDFWTAVPGASPQITVDPAKANPFGFGSAASGGSTLSLSAGVSAQASPVDLYAALQSDLLA